MDDVERFVSPDGKRIAMLNHRTGEVWYAKLLGPGEAADLMTLLPDWRRLRPHPAAPPEARRRSFRVIQGDG